MSVWTLVEEYVKFFWFFFNQRYQSHLWQSDQLLIKTNVKKKKPLCYIYAIKKNNNPHLLPKSQNLVLWVYNADQRGSNVKEKKNWRLQESNNGSWIFFCSVLDNWNHVYISSELNIHHVWFFSGLHFSSLLFICFTGNTISVWMAHSPILKGTKPILSYIPGNRKRNLGLL